MDDLDGGEWGDAEDPIEIDMGDDLIADGAGDENAGDDPNGIGKGDGDLADNDIFVPPSQGADPLL